MSEPRDSPRRERLRVARYLVGGIMDDRFGRGIDIAIDREEQPGKDFTLYLALRTALFAEGHPVGIGWEVYRGAVDKIVDAAELHQHEEHGPVQVRWSDSVQRLHDNMVRAIHVASDGALPTQARLIGALYAISQMHALLVDEVNGPYFKKELSGSPRPVWKASEGVRDFFELKWGKPQLPIDLTTLRRAAIHGRVTVSDGRVDVFDEDGRLIADLHIDDLLSYIAVGRAAWIAFHLDVLFVAAQADLLAEGPRTAAN